MSRCCALQSSLRQAHSLEKGTQVVLFISQADGWARRAGREPGGKGGKGEGKAAFALSDVGGEGPALDRLSTI